MESTSLHVQKGFTLLEVLVAFTIMAMLLTLILQTQAESINYAEKNRTLSLVQAEVREQILAVERGDERTMWAPSGKFEEGHPLEGMTFLRTETMESMGGVIDLTRVTFRVSWQHKGIEQNYETFTYAP